MYSIKTECGSIPLPSANLNKMKNSDTITIRKSEVQELLRQAMVLENLLSSLIDMNYSDIPMRNLENMVFDVSQIIRTTSKSLERVEKITKSK